MQSADRKVAYAFVLVFGLIALFIGGGLLFGDAPLFQKCAAIEGEHSRTDSKQAETGSSITHLPGPQTGSTSAEPSQANQNCSEDPAMAQFTWQLARYTMGLFFATILLGILGLIQLVFLGKADKTGRLTAQAAADTAKAALHGSRAHIWMKNLTFEVTRDAAGVINGHNVGYEIWNGGATPGIAKSVYIEMFEDPLSQWPATPNFQPGGIIEHCGLVAPNLGQSRNKLGFQVTVDQAMLNGFITGNRALIFWGYVTYVDVFDATKEHEATYAYRLSIPAGSDKSTSCSFQGPIAYWSYT